MEKRTEGLESCRFFTKISLDESSSRTSMDGCFFKASVHRVECSIKMYGQVNEDTDDTMPSHPEHRWSPCAWCAPVPVLGAWWTAVTQAATDPTRMQLQSSYSASEINGNPTFRTKPSLVILVGSDFFSLWNLLKFTSILEHLTLFLKT